MRVAQIYRVGRKQPDLDFVDVAIKNDVACSSIRRNPNAAGTWEEDCVVLHNDSDLELLVTARQRSHSRAQLELLVTARQRSDFEHSPSSSGSGSRH